MAKIGSLTVDTIKIRNGALTRFFGGAGTSVQVLSDTPNPVELFVRAAGSITVTRSRGGVVIGQVSSSQIAALFVDPSPANGDVYTINGNTSGSPSIVAVVRLR